MRAFTGLYVCLILTFAGCSPVPGSRPPAQDVPVASIRFKVGAAIGDITPPPGYPMGGHSISGEIGRGYWLRPCVRAIYILDKEGHAVVLVSCELWSFPAGLGDRITELLATLDPHQPLTRSQLVLCATHTHHSPGNFSSSAFYNAYGSKEGGFDPVLFEFLANQIAITIEQAKATAQDGVLSFAQSRLTGIARNRSVDAFKHDPEAAEIMKENADLPLGQTTAIFPDADAFRAIDPTLSVLKLSATDGHVIALAVFAAMHPTTMSHDFLLYSGELYGAAALMAEHRLASQQPSPIEIAQSVPASEDIPPERTGPVVAMFNGAEGDVSPNWVTQGRATTLKLADQLATAAVSTAEGSQCKTLMSPGIELRYEVCRLAGATYIDPSGVNHQVDDMPVPGVGTIGGAADGMTIMHRLGWNERITGTPTPTQGNKQPAFDIRGSTLPITRSIIAKLSYPTRVPLGVYQIGDITLATLPGEFTTVMGRRIRSSIALATSSDPRRILLMGLCNEYVSYIATPEEYAVQDYEGASTFYGPWSGPFFQQALCALARAPASMNPPAIRASTYDPGPEKRFKASSIAPLTYWSRHAYDDVIQDSDGHAFNNAPAFEWEDSEPTLGTFTAGHRALPEVWIQQLDRQHHWVSMTVDGPETDHGLNIPVVLLDGRNGIAHWRAWWIPPATAKIGQTYRFSVRCVNDAVIHSGPIVLRQ